MSCFESVIFSRAAFMAASQSTCQYATPCYRLRHNARATISTFDPCCGRPSLENTTFVFSMTSVDTVDVAVTFEVATMTFLFVFFTKKTKPKNLKQLCPSRVHERVPCFITVQIIRCRATSATEQQLLSSQRRKGFNLKFHK